MASRLVRELTLFIIESWEGVSIDSLEKVYPHFSSRLESTTIL